MTKDLPQGRAVAQVPCVLVEHPLQVLKRVLESERAALVSIRGMAVTQLLRLKAEEGLLRYMLREAEGRPTTPGTDSSCSDDEESCPCSSSFDGSGTCGSDTPRTEGIGEHQAATVAAGNGHVGASSRGKERNPGKGQKRGREGLESVAPLCEKRQHADPSALDACQRPGDRISDGGRASDGGSGTAGNCNERQVTSGDRKLRSVCDASGKGALAQLGTGGLDRIAPGAPTQKMPASCTSAQVNPGRTEGLMSASERFREDDRVLQEVEGLLHGMSAVAKD
ncbi:unnamed protein product [Ostreobium quekettii]|uniref:Uncharacterized protein n=1 Tax=Ostreobium quekettii TaxID=121088 RepID=A0A8S1JD72_9CHLO|nr:unnamed protein product [Ostreobium quekettii]|eukprot:evm.model.scf_421.6 EVM.evm.TU.scf_421.6   scf_421:51565-52993(+)